MSYESTMNKNQSGFTIVELLISIVVFAIVVPGLASFLNFISSLNDRARDVSVINAMVENKVEALRSVSFVGVGTGTTDFSDELPQHISRPRTATYEISSVSPSLKQIDVTVTYNDSGSERTLTYRTYLGELGVGQY